jgi:hypothetical protein
MRRRLRGDVLNRHRVVPDHFDLRTQLAQTMGEVIGE